MGVVEVASETTEHGLPSETVSGWSVFWAMVAIVSHAMLQISFTGYLWNGNLFKGSLWPHRSSPSICLIDGIADAYLIIRSIFIRSPDAGNDEKGAGVNGVLTKLALFFLGVVPQAIKLFSMKGIPITQAVAGMYLLPSTLGLIRSLTCDSPEIGIQQLHESLAQSKSWSEAILKAALAITGWLPHIVGAFFIWYGVVDRIGFSASQDVVNAFAWLSLFLNIFVLFFILLNIGFVLVKNRRSPVPGYPVSMIMAYTNIFSIPDLAGKPGAWISRGSSGHTAKCFQFMASLFLACYFISSMLHYVECWVRKSCDRCGRRHWVYSKCRPSALDYPLATVEVEGNISRGTDTEDGLPTFRELVVNMHTYPSDQNDAQESGITQSVSPKSVSPEPEAVDVTDSDAQRTGSPSTYENDQPGSAADSTVDDRSDEPITIEPESEPETWLQWISTWLQIVVFAIPVGFFMLVVLTSMSVESYLDPSEAADETAAQQQAAEEGAAETAKSAPGKSKLPYPVRAVIHGLEYAFRLTLRFVFRVIGRILLGTSVLFFYTMNWLWDKVTKKYPIKILINAFGLFNFSMAVLYYLVFFDDEGTFAPAWSEMFGR